MASVVRGVALLATALIFGTAAAVAVEVTIEVQYPQSNLDPGVGMFLAGTAPLHWNTFLPMTSTAPDLWSVTFSAPQSLSNTTPSWGISFKVLAGGQFELGMNHRVTVNWTQPPVTRRVWPYFVTLAGKQATLTNVFSPQLNNSRDVWIYMPPAMVENPYFVAERVLLMHDGQNLAPLWNVSEHLDALAIEQQVEQVFVVGPYNTPDRIAEYTYSVDKPYGGGKGDLYLDFLVQTLLPLVASKYKIVATVDTVTMGGSSLGGLISCYGGVTRPTVFRRVMCMSSSFWWNNGDFLSTIVPRIVAQPTDPTSSLSQKFYIDSGNSGDSDDDVADTSLVSTAFITTGKGFVLGQNLFWYMQAGGSHNEYWWSKRLHHPLRWFFGRNELYNE